MEMEKCWCCGKLCKEDEMTRVRNLDVGGEGFYCPWCVEGMLEVIYMETFDSDIEVCYPGEW